MCIFSNNPVFLLKVILFLSSSMKFLRQFLPHDWNYILKVGVPAFILGIQIVLTWYSSGKTTGVVLYGVTHTAPIHQSIKYIHFHKSFREWFSRSRYNWLYEKIATLLWKKLYVLKSFFQSSFDEQNYA